jgi:hypothetical protein
MEKRNWFKDNGIGLAIVTLLVGNFYWTDAKFSHIDERFVKMDERFIAIEKDVAIIKTVLLMKNILPVELAKEGEK